MAGAYLCGEMRAPSRCFHKKALSVKGCAGICAHRSVNVCVCMVGVSSGGVSAGRILALLPYGIGAG